MSLDRRTFLNLGAVSLGALAAELLPGRALALGPESESEFEALRLELARGVAELRLPDSPLPYAAHLRAVRAESLTLDGSYGGVIVDLRSSDALASVGVRVGSPERDNTNFFGGNVEPSFRLGRRPDPQAARKRLWLAMDASFRAASIAYQSKQSAIDRLADTDLPDDQGPAPAPLSALAWASPDPGSGGDSPSALTDPPLADPGPGFDRPGLRQLAADLSGRFADHPSIDNGDVVIQEMRSHEYTLSSEGVAMGVQVDRSVLGVVAQTQADDGMELDHGLAIHLSNLSTAAELRERGTALVDRVLGELEALAAAPMLDEDYDGPVLLGPEAAAQLLASTIPVHAGGEPAPLSDYGRLLELEPHWHEKLGAAVLPEFLDLVDDPLSAGFGHYELDAQGYPAERLELVRAGVLHTLLMTRRPNPHIGESNGHARATAAGFMGPCISNLTLSSRNPGLSQAKLERELLRRAREDGYEFAYIVESLRDGSVLGSPPRDSAMVFTSGRKVTLPLPSRVFRIAAEGRRGALVRTQVRGSMFAPMSMRALRRIRAVGDVARSSPMRVAPGFSGGFAADLGLDGLLAQTVDIQVTTPALLIDGLELTIERGENGRLPILDHPLRREP